MDARHHEKESKEAVSAAGGAPLAVELPETLPVESAVGVRAEPQAPGSAAIADETGEPATVATLESGAVIEGRYRIRGLLGKGGHGVVYEAEHVALGYSVAIKVMHGAVDPADRRRIRFRREGLLGARVRHRNIATIHEAGQLPDGSPFLVMEHVRGVDLGSILDRACLDPEATIDVGSQLLAALVALADAGVIHRDVKPGNVMLQRATDGVTEVKLLDFGIARGSRRETDLVAAPADEGVLGTPPYMSPEQCRGEAVDLRTDLYAVGIVLYECLTGSPPFASDTTTVMLTRILDEDAPPLRSVRNDVPLVLAEVIERAIAKDPDARWQHPAEMADALISARIHLGLRAGALAWSRLSSSVVPELGERSIDPARSRNVDAAALERAREQDRIPTLLLLNKVSKDRRPSERPAGPAPVEGPTASGEQSVETDAATSNEAGRPRRRRFSVSRWLSMFAFVLTLGGIAAWAWTNGDRGLELGLGALSNDALELPLLDR